MKPFRWNIKKKEQLGTLLSGARSHVFNSFGKELAECASSVISASGNYNLVFVGRSPENIFDYLSGVLSSTTWEERLFLLNISNRFRDINSIKGKMNFSYESLKTHFHELSLSPKQILSSKNGVCFVDLVDSGGTFSQIFNFLIQWCKEEKGDEEALKKKLRFVGITDKRKNSPNTWRWQQHADWVKNNPTITIKNISISWKLWNLLGNIQDKVSNTNTPNKWGADEILLPPREQSNLRALRLAYDLYTRGMGEKSDFAKILGSEPSNKHKWFRGIVSEIKKLSL